ncbi:hypothetical protein BC834DRAFT_116274 [Gloeopeniophorella convolvens]|nr:hypothetical protein BC834DRAFT_116274 [Gloeopeniophorella convolvens]
MASFNVTAEDSSPLISYSPVGAWADSPNGDPNTQSYSQQSWHTSSSQGASATIQFNGTGIWLFGSKRPNYGSYSISIDGQSVDGSAQAGSASFQQLLGGKSGLTNAPHTAVLTNTGDGAPIDLDSIVFETQVGSPGSTVSDSSTDDNGGAITYLPSSADWNLNDLQGCFDNTLHYTQTGGAQAQFSFNGDAVAIYGTVSPDHANYTITVDGQTHPFLGGSNGLASTLHIGTLLYFANGFQPGPHNVTLTANPEQAGQQNTGKFMDIDRVQVFVASPGTANATQGNQGSAVPQANQEKAA